MTWQAEAAKRCFTRMAFLSSPSVDNETAVAELAKIISDTYAELGPRFATTVEEPNGVQESRLILLREAHHMYASGERIGQTKFWKMGDAVRAVDRLNSALHGGGA